MVASYLASAHLTCPCLTAFASKPPSTIRSRLSCSAEGVPQITQGNDRLGTPEPGQSARQKWTI
jgi:hypothetical protein